MRSRSLLLFIFLIPILLLGGCARWGSPLAPLPVEIELITTQAVALTLEVRKVPVEQAEKIKPVLMDVKVLLLTTLRENPQDLEMVELAYLTKLTPLQAALTRTLTQALILRIRLLIDQGQTDLAAQYLEATLNGGVKGIDLYVRSKAQATSLVLIVMSLSVKDFDI